MWSKCGSKWSKCWFLTIWANLEPIHSPFWTNFNHFLTHLELKFDPPSFTCPLSWWKDQISVKVALLSFTYANLYRPWDQSLIVRIKSVDLKKFSASMNLWLDPDSFELTSIKNAAILWESFVPLCQHFILFIMKKIAHYFCIDSCFISTNFQ